VPSQYATHPITISGFTGAMFNVLMSSSQERAREKIQISDKGLIQ
jgi:hypothetical protein